MGTLHGQRRGPALVFKLDDGSVIGDGKRLVGDTMDGQVVFLDMERAFHLGHLKEKDVQRITSHLDHFQQRGTQLQNIPQPVLKSGNPYAPEVSGQPGPPAEWAGPAQLPMSRGPATSHWPQRVPCRATR